MQFLKTLPGQLEYVQFEALPKTLYAPESPRHHQGHDPEKNYLEGAYVLCDGDRPMGRFAFYENPGLNYCGVPAACIGSYECVEDPVISRALLTQAKTLARRKGYRYMLGPMEGSTWNSYRFNLQQNHRPFFMEPYHHSYYNKQFRAAGFESISHYATHLASSSSYDAHMIDAYERRFEVQGACFRALDAAHLSQELSRIAVLSNAGFVNNFLFSPIDPEAFVAQYSVYASCLDPRLIRMVEDAQGQLQAFIFAIKDYADPSGTTMILKSMVRNRYSEFRGIGTYLMAKATQLGEQLGYKQVLHAFMHQANTSMDISQRLNGDVLTTYALYGIAL